MGGVTFSTEQEKEAEFWAWLTDGHVIFEPLTPQPSGKANQRFRIVYTEEIKQLITDALDKGDKSLVNKLLEIASQPQPLSNDLLRKSMRVGNGEYLKLLYVKLLEKTSFSEVIVRMLIPYATDYLASFRSQHESELGDKSQRLNHLISLIESWPSMSPESRSRAVDMGFIDYEGMNEVLPDYPHKLNDIKTTVSGVILGELEKELFGPLDHRNKVYEEFKREWSRELSENPLNSMTLEASIDPRDTNRVVFTPKVLLAKRLTVEDQEKLFEKYGDLDVVDFVQKYTPTASGNKKDEYMGLVADRELREICIYREVSLPACSAYVKDPIDFEVEDASPTILLDRIEKDSIQLRAIIEALGKRVDIDIFNFFGREFERIRKLPSENEYAAATMLAKSITLTNFLKIATKLAKTTDDFSMIGTINSCRNRIVDYEKVQNFVSDLVDSSIRRRSVVSFYVSKDVWRFLPLAIKGKDWITIANTYLASRLK